jgi:putative tryptophan/tyrosine transport system substrate-binding protein
MEEKKPATVESNLTQKVSLPEVQVSSSVPKKNKPLWTILILAILLVFVAIGVYFLFFQNKKTKVYHVGILSCLDYFSPIPEGFKSGMAEFGYVEGKNIVYDVRKSSVESDKEMQQILQEFVDQKVDLIVVAPTSVAIKAKEITKGKGIPVVFASAFVEGNNLIDSVGVAGGNITGIRWSPGTELAVKYIEIFHAIAPQAKRVWLAYDDNSLKIVDLDVLNSETSALGVSLVEVPLKSVEDVKLDLSTRQKRNDLGIDAMIVTTSSIASSEGLEQIVEFATKYNIPLMGGRTNDISIFSLSPEPFASGKQAAYLGNKILRGSNPSSLPVITVENKFTINYKLIKKLGLDVPEGLLGQASEIIR